jgi:hypothetical protein
MTIHSILKYHLTTYTNTLTMDHTPLITITQWAAFTMLELKKENLIRIKNMESINLNLTTAFQRKGKLSMMIPIYRTNPKHFNQESKGWSMERKALNWSKGVKTLGIWETLAMVTVLVANNPTSQSQI